MTSALQEFMSSSAWHAYKRVAEGGQFEFAKPLPGWQVVTVHDDGSLEDYEESTNRQAYCRRHRIGVLPVLKPALEYCVACDCGIRVTRDVWSLLWFTNYHRIQHYMDPYRNLEDETPLMALARVQASGTAEASLDGAEPPFTIRASQAQLVEIYLPTEQEGVEVPADLAEKIQGRYNISTQLIEGTIYHYPGTTLEPDQPKEWPEQLQTMLQDLKAAQDGNLA